jgi:DNA-binding MarR family transcriptional regulator
VDKGIERAIKLEALVPRLIRSMFQHKEDSQWIELPVGQIRMMRLLYAGPSTPSELSSQLSLSVSAVTQVANRLEAQGFIERSEDCEDRRVRHLRLSARGHSLMYRRHTARVQQAQRALAALDEKTQEQIIDSLEALLSVCQPSLFQGVESSDVTAEIEQLLPPPPPYLLTEEPV